MSTISLAAQADLTESQKVVIPIVGRSAGPDMKECGDADITSVLGAESNDGAFRGLVLRDRRGTERQHPGSGRSTARAQ